MMILEFVSKIGLKFAELINSGIVSYVVTKVAENTEYDKKIKKNIKERANVCKTLAPNSNENDESILKTSSENIDYNITIKNCQNCNVYINTSPDKE